ncbi:zinc/manganese transport system permease protein [Streptoalloteichus tenebrarius]|uniref:Zinc/manganese transport system permease protein n=2 Tax=Streptoalloteichus tenebrarius (strain ATCC 17920 / DSM 40477 / JCM 4838 / CBS 697.72 / NBRC 16177 / NCIMB 11028 / NRRL B-12390 / A12253. 1 / ISP 5477) TaxID=1933 RepID=A0ABT1HYU0_STRSD|nr:metal ABC transporter permease [Streptoalloteichus tenebrarius]MCP2260655.1 zinc/manganese transport system permease protein [Streptoalloteichus tenebrarius]BFF01539.1 metal ABC transporter permease [Streptoalloteichus tenebrarius]
MTRFLDLSATLDLLGYDFVQHALLAAAVLGLVSGALAPLVVARQMSFAVHGTAELAFTGGAAALLLGWSVGAGALAGAVVAALLLGLLGQRDGERDSVIGVVLSFGLGLGVLLLWLYPGRAANKFSLLVGQIVGVDSTDLALLAGAALVVLVVLAVVYRPLLFSSVDPAVAVARGVPARALSPLFAVLVGVATALGVQTVGALLVLALMVTPGAAATRVTANPVLATVLAVVFAEVAAVGGILLSLAPGVPVSGFVTGISFLIYLACRGVAATRRRRVAAA